MMKDDDDDMLMMMVLVICSLAWMIKVSNLIDICLILLFAYYVIMSIDALIDSMELVSVAWIGGLPS